MSETEDLRRAAAERALDEVRDGMALGLGSGSTASMMVQGLAERLRDGRLRDIVGVPTSERTAALARKLSVPLVALADRPALDLAIDGADEIDPRLNLTKGLGGALLREKVVAASAARFLVIADESKLVARLGERAPIPVEVIAFALPLCERRLAALGAAPALRRAADGAPHRTDEGNVILDCRLPSAFDPALLAAQIAAIPGVVGHGLFVGMAEAAVVAGRGGVRAIRPA